MSEEIKGLDLVRNLSTFGVGEKKRKYFLLTLPYEIARLYFVPKIYHAATGEGEQRELITSHVKNIKQEIVDGNFTPSTVSATASLEYVTELPNNKIQLLLSPGQSLPLTDGQHRYEALRRLSEDEEFKHDALKSDVAILINVGGDTKKDFLNLQKGRTVDRSHIYSLSVDSGNISEKFKDILPLSYKIAKSIHANKDSPFYNQLRFDSSQVSGIPINTLSSKTASDSGTSLIGAAKIVKLAEKDDVWYTKVLNKTFNQIKSAAPELTLVGARLTPPPQGSKGAATMIIGVANMVAYRLHMLKLDEPDEQTLSVLIEAAKKCFAGAVDGNYGGPIKRDLLGDFADKFFADIIDDEENHHGVPYELAELLSCSTFSVPKLPKKSKNKLTDKYDDSEVQKKLYDNNESEAAPWDDNELQA